MAFDFMSPNLLPDISCSKPSFDGYDVQNLISTSSTNGFLAESFVKPPVDICITFSCNIDIKKVVIGCKVGSQCTSCIQIFTHSVEWKPDNCTLLEKGKNVKLNDSDVLNPIGKGYHESVDTFCFINKMYRERLPFKSWAKIPEKEHVSCEFTISSKKIRSISDVSHLNIRILKTRGYICAIKFIEVWGQPSFKCSKNKSLVKSLEAIINKMTLSSIQPKYSHIESNKKLSKCLATECKEINTTGLADEFIDPLTYDFMRLPVLLPSGYTVDQSTLDRFCKTEEKWGRAPSDPFTGKPFTANNKPLPNSALKARIDKYLLSSHNANLGVAIVGSSSHNPSAVSTLVPQKEESNVGMSMKTLMSNKDSKPLFAFKEEPFVMRATKRKSESQDVDAKRIQYPANHDMPHSSNLKSSLDAALGELFKDKDEKIHQLDSDMKYSIKCAKCKNLDNLYQLVCMHLLCRTCLFEIKRTSMACFECSKSIRNEDVVKLHIK